MCSKKKVLSSLVIFITLSTFLPAVSFSSSATEAERVLKNVIRAYGGDRALTCNSAALDVDVVLVQPKGIQCEGKIFTKGDMFRLEYKLAENHIYRMGSDGTQAWLIAEPAAKEAKKLDAVQVGVFKLYGLIFSLRWLQYLRSHAKSLRYSGQETYEGVLTEVLGVNVETIGNVRFLIDANSHLLKALRFDFPGEWQPRYEIVYGTYDEKDSIKIPKTISIIRDKQHYREYKVKNVQLCLDIADAKFAPDPL